MIYDYKNNEKVQCTYLITKEAEETIYFYAKQMDCTEDEALDKLIICLGITEIGIPILESLGYKFDPKKAP